MQPSYKFSSLWRGHWTKCGGNSLVAQNILRSIASSNVALHSSKDDAMATLTKMGHSKKVAKKHYQSGAKNGLAVQGLVAITAAAKKNKKHRQRTKNAVKNQDN